MAGSGYVSVPITILADTVYGGRIIGAGIEGKGVTGADLQLWYAILDAARTASTAIVELPQATITRALNRENPKRIRDGLGRLRGTTMHLGGTILPTVIEFEHIGTGRMPRIWRIQIDKRLLDLVHQSTKKGGMVGILGSQLANLSSKYSMGIYSRFLAWMQNSYPQDRAIRFTQLKGKTAFQLDIPVDKVPSVFAFRDHLRHSEIKRLLVTQSPKCPLKRELSHSSVEIDTFAVTSDATGELVALKVMISTTSVEGLKLAYIKAQQQHRGDCRIFCARGLFSSVADEPFAEDDGELGFCLAPLPRGPFPVLGGVVENQI